MYQDKFESLKLCVCVHWISLDEEHTLNALENCIDYSALEEEKLYAYTLNAQEHFIQFSAQEEELM